MSDRIDAIVERYQRAFDAAVAKSDEARRAGTMVGRMLSFPYADSAAYYEIVRVTRNKVKLAHLDLWDGWTIPLIESQSGWISRAEAERMLAREDALAAWAAGRAGA